MNFYTGEQWAPLVELNNMAAGSNVQVHVQATNIWEAGESEARLLTNGVPFAKIVATHWRVPFGVSLAGPSAGTNEITMERGRPVALVLSNADAMTYPVRWDLTIGGQSVAGGLATAYPSSQVVAGSISRAQVFSWKPCSWFSDQYRDALLSLRWEPTTQTMSSQTQQKIIPVRLRLPMSGMATKTRAVARNSWVICLLILGAACSWALNLTLPNVRRRSILKTTLAALAERTHNLSTQVDSSLRVVLRVQRMRLGIVLKRLSNWSPATSADLDTVQAGVTGLDRQITLVERVDRIYDMLAGMRTSFIPPTTLAMVDDSLGQASRLLRATSPTDADVQAGDTLIKDAESRLSRLGQTDDGLSLIIARRIKSVRSRLANAFLKPGICEELCDKLPGLLTTPLAKNDAGQPTNISPDLFLNPQFEQAANITQDLYQQLDSKSRKLELVADYIQVMSSGQTPERAKATQASAETLLGQLKVEGYISLQQAGRLAREMQDGIFANDIQAELAPGPIDGANVEPRATIEISQTAARPFEPLQFRLAFRNQVANSAAARDEFTYEWDFGKQFIESGKSLTVWHYFTEAAEEKTITVRIYKAEDGMLAATLTKTIKVEQTPSENPFYFSDKTWAETLRVALALLAPMLALVAGAREKLFQQDFLTSAIAIFLMGFTANAIKDLLTQGAPAPANSAKNGS